MTLPCGTCKYNGFRGLVQTCRHPDHPQPINGPLMLRIGGNGGKCSDFIDLEKKANSAEEIDWPQPISFMEVTHGTD